MKTKSPKFDVRSTAEGKSAEQIAGTIKPQISRSISVGAAAL
jgi:hypothetical protein